MGDGYGGTGAGTGDFYIDIENIFLYIETNTICNFHVEGKSKYFDAIFTWGDGIFYGENYTITKNINIFHRGTNDIIIKPEYIVKGKLLSLGNLVLKNNPQELDVEILNSGRIIFDF